MNMGCMNPTRWWYSNKKVAKIDKDVYKIPLCEAISFRIGASSYKPMKSENLNMYQLVKYLV